MSFPQSGVGDTQVNAGSSAAPGANVAVAQLSALDAGRYYVKATTVFTAGVPAAAEDNNLAIKRGGASGTVLGKVITTRALNTPTVLEMMISVDSVAGASLSLATVGAATAGVQYGATLIAQKMY